MLNSCCITIFDDLIERISCSCDILWQCRTTSPTCRSWCCRRRYNNCRRIGRHGRIGQRWSSCGIGDSCCCCPTGSRGRGRSGWPCDCRYVDIWIGVSGTIGFGSIGQDNSPRFKMLGQIVSRRLAHIFQKSIPFCLSVAFDSRECSTIQSTINLHQF